MHQQSSDDEEDEERSRDKNDEKRARILNGKMKSNSSKKTPVTSSAAPVPSSSKKSPVPQAKTSAPIPASASSPQPMKIDIDLEITDDLMNGDLMITPDDDADADLTIMGVEEMQEIQQEIEKDLFPTITSVTSLHPSNNEQFNEFFAANPLENGGVL